LYRKIRDISDLTPLELINIISLKKAAELLAEGNIKFTGFQLLWDIALKVT
jgi:two-component system cell cycle response regulator